jgi:hypothetical protein
MGSLTTSWRQILLTQLQMSHTVKCYPDHKQAHSTGRERPAIRRRCPHTVPLEPMGSFLVIHSKQKEREKKVSY